VFAGTEKTTRTEKKQVDDPDENLWGANEWALAEEKIRFQSKYARCGGYRGESQGKEGGKRGM